MKSKWNELKEWLVETLGLTRKYGDLEVGMSIVLKKMFDLDKKDEHEKRNRDQE